MISPVHWSLEKKLLEDWNLFRRNKLAKTNIFSKLPVWFKCIYLTFVMVNWITLGLESNKNDIYRCSIGLLIILFSNFLLQIKLAPSSLASVMGIPTCQWCLSNHNKESSGTHLLLEQCTNILETQTHSLNEKSQRPEPLEQDMKAGHENVWTKTEKKAGNNTWWQRQWREQINRNDGL